MAIRAGRQLIIGEPAVGLSCSRPPERAPRHVVDLVAEGVEAVPAVDCKVRPFRQPPSGRSVEVLVPRPLPAVVCLAEIDADATQMLEVTPSDHLATLVPGEGLAQLRVDAVEQLARAGQHLGRAVAVGQVPEKIETADPVDKGHDR